MCICHQQRSPHSSQTHHRLLPQVGEHWPAGVSISDPKLGRSHQELPAGAVIGHCIGGRAGSAWVAQRAWAQVPSQALGLLSVTCYPHCQEGGSPGATECLLLPSVLDTLAALLPGPPLGSSGAGSGFGKLLEVLFPLSGSRELIYSVSLN